jgi:hypothetical protein
MHGDRSGEVWMLLKAGVTAGISKEVDATTQLIIEALVSTATDASTAGTAKIVSSCVSTFFRVDTSRTRCSSAEVYPVGDVFDRPVEIVAQTAGPVLEP